MSLMLIIDTSLQTAFVGLSKNGKLLNSRYSHDQKDHSVFIHKAIKTLLSENGFSLKDLVAVATVIGPGSYTGLRVGLSTSKGLCYALGIPLISIGSLELLAASVAATQSNTLICPMIDARRMEVFTAIYVSENKSIRDPYAVILNPNSFADLLENHEIIFTGNGSEKFKNIAEHPNAKFQNPSAAAEVAAMLGFKRFNEKRFENLVHAVPLYVKEHESFTERNKS
jgi:tRNA threonylcarbamoyladenosine biosynthesis protein TsaB